MVTSRFDRNHYECPPSPLRRMSRMRHSVLDWLQSVWEWLLPGFGRVGISGGIQVSLFMRTSPGSHSTLLDRSEDLLHFESSLCPRLRFGSGNLSLQPARRAGRAREGIEMNLTVLSSKLTGVCLLVLLLAGQLPTAGSISTDNERQHNSCSAPE